MMEPTFNEAMANLNNAPPMVNRFFLAVDLVEERMADLIATQSMQLFKKEAEDLDVPGSARGCAARPLFHNRVFV